MLLENPEMKRLSVENIMADPFPIVDMNTTSDEISDLLSKRSAVIVLDEDGEYQIITKYDVIQALTNGGVQELKRT